MSRYSLKNFSIGTGLVLFALLVGVVLPILIYKDLKIRSFHDDLLIETFYFIGIFFAGLMFTFPPLISFPVFVLLYGGFIVWRYRVLLRKLAIPERRKHSLRVFGITYLLSTLICFCTIIIFIAGMDGSST